MTLTYYDTIFSHGLMTPSAFDGQYYLSTPKSYEHPDTVKQKRIRKVHTKVRTGCLTCKARRKKCDETKPACLKCSSTGRKCDGYALDLKKQALPASTSIIAARNLESDSQAPSYPEQVLPGETAFPSWWTLATMPRKVPQIDLFDVLTIDTDEINRECVKTTEESSCASEDARDDLSVRSGRSSTNSTSPITFSIDTDTSIMTPAHTPVHRPSRKLRLVLPISYAATPMLSITPSTYQQVTDLERHCFTFFRYHTAPSFASYFNFGLFQNHVIRAALEDPVVLSCAAALGAVHRRYEHGISREAFEYCVYAAKLGEEALKRLAAYKANSIESDGMTKAHCRDTIALSEIILSLFESFQGEHEKTVKHVYNGMKELLERPMTLMHRESHYCMLGPSSNIFPRLFNQLARSAHRLFDTPPQILARQTDGRSLPSIPPKFASLEEARDYMLTEFYWIRNTPITTWRDASRSREAQRLHVRRISQWGVSYAETIKTTTMTPRKNRACKMMKLTRTASYFIIYSLLSTNLDIDLSPFPHFHSSEPDYLADHDDDQAYTADMLWQIISKREKLVAHLTSLNVLVESNLDETHVFHYEEHSFSLDSAIGPPQSKIVPESSGKIRHMVKYFGSEESPDDELWSVLGMYGIAEKWSGVEEHAVINGIKAIIPETVDPKWVDISWMMESRKILLRYCRPDEHGLEWVQEWWRF